MGCLTNRKRPLQINFTSLSPRPLVILSRSTIQSYKTVPDWTQLKSYFSGKQLNRRFNHRGQAQLRNSLTCQLKSKTLSFSRLFFIFQSNVQKFWTFQKAKINKRLPRCFKKSSLWPFTLDDWTLWWRHTMQVLDRFKNTMHKLVSNTHASFQSECAKTCPNVFQKNKDYRYLSNAKFWQKLNTIS